MNAIRLAQMETLEHAKTLRKGYAYRTSHFALDRSRSRPSRPTRRPLCLHTSTVTEQLQHIVQHAPEGSALANGRARHG